MMQGKRMQMFGATFVAVLMTSALATTPVFAATNLVSNGDFETAVINGLPTGWHKGGWGTNTKTFAYPVAGVDGSSAAQVSVTTYTSGDAKWYFTPIALATGIYTYSDFYKSDIPSIVTMQYHNADGTFTFHDLTQSPAAASFTRGLVDFVVPPGVQDVTIFRLIKGVGTLTVDNVSVIPSTNTNGIFASGAVTLTFDNGWLSQFQNAIPKMENKDFKGTFYIITHELADFGFPGFVSKAQIQDMFSTGEEIGSHTQTHADLLMLTTVQQQQEIDASRQDLLALNVGPINSFAYPFGDYNPTIIPLVKDAGYTNARTVMSGFATPNTDPYQLPRKIVVSSTTPAQLESWIDEAAAEKSWLIIEFHQVDTSGNTYAITPDNFNQVIDFLAQKGIPVITVDQGVNSLNGHTVATTTTPMAPVISGVAASDIDTSTAAILWATDLAATSKVLFGTTTSYGSSISLNAATTTAHSVTLTDLAQSTLYHFQVVSTNAGGTATSSDATFTTVAASSTPPTSTSTSATTTQPPAPAPVVSGGGGNGPIVGSFGVTNTVPQGAVLGTSTAAFRFAKTLSWGMHHIDVTELQKRLVSEGFLTLDIPTRYFGPMTRKAVKAYQVKHGIEQVGVVGPKTRAMLNSY